MLLNKSESSHSPPLKLESAPTRGKLRPLFWLHFFLAFLIPLGPVLAVPPGDIYIPFVSNSTNQTAHTGPVVNMPYFEVRSSASEVIQDHFSEMAIFWFGQVRPDLNYTDVRIAYTQNSLVIRTAVFDRGLFYNPDSVPYPNDLENWDSISVAIQTSSAKTAFPSSIAHRFSIGLRHWQDMLNYKRQYSGDGSGWTAVTAPDFYANATYRGELGFNIDPPPGDARNRGWEAIYYIPFTRLGLSGPPPAGTFWRISVKVFDRDAAAAAGPVTIWPTDADLNVPSTWANLRFGLPPAQVPAQINSQTVILKNNINGISVMDAHVGGAFLCGTTQNFFDVWGNLNYYNVTTNRDKVNIQNQKDIADFACFSKYFITFPYTNPPSLAGKIIRSARLEMSQYGGSEPANAQPSYIQAFAVDSEWSDQTITWNNAPQAVENLGGTWISVYAPVSIPWPTIPRYSWDVTRAVVAAYAKGLPVRLALYSADSPRHSGKYFISSETGADWNARNLPALVIEYVDP